MQVASQYFTVFVLPHSASLDFSALYHLMASEDADFPGGGAKWAAAEDFQKALWWYNGAGAQRKNDTRPGGAGVMALPPVMTAAQLFKEGDYAMAAFREAYGGVADAGLPATRAVGNISMPTLFVCGSSDSSLLCNHPYSLASKDYVSAPYSYLEVDCGHDLLACTKHAETERVIQGIVAHLVGIAARR